jgi:hypothetical protein
MSRTQGPARLGDMVALADAARVHADHLEAMREEHLAPAAADPVGAVAAGHAMQEDDGRALALDFVVDAYTI